MKDDVESRVDVATEVASLRLRLRAAETRARHLEAERAQLVAPYVDEDHRGGSWAKVWMALKLRVDALTTERVGLLNLVDELTDSEPCRLDHNGACQEHRFPVDGMECPMVRAVRLLTAEGRRS